MANRWARMKSGLGGGVAAIALALGAGAAEAAAPTIWPLGEVTQVGGVPTEVWGHPRVSEGAAGFDGRADGIVVPANPLAGWTAWTVEILFRPDEGGPAAQRFFHAQELGDGGRRALIETRLDGKGRWWLDTFLHAGRSERALIDPQRVHATGRWHWVALRYDGKTMAHFVDGVQEGAGEVDFGTMRDGRVSLGVRQTRNYWFKGAIREVRFTPAALAPERLQRAK